MLKTIVTKGDGFLVVTCGRFNGVIILKTTRRAHERKSIDSPVGGGIVSRH
jgi:hypothetical protein